jgi:hypothetical protein
MSWIEVIALWGGGFACGLIVAWIAAMALVGR